ncbi:MAG: molecular chaperone DjlA [Pseudomonadota bacterium]
MNSRNAGGPTETLPEGLSELLRELSSCGHHGSRFLERTGLPRWTQGTLFRLLGFVAKADDRVTEQDIRYGESLMRSFGARARLRRRLIRRFSAGKRDTSPVVPAWFRYIARRWPESALRTSIALAHICYQDGPDSAARIARCHAAIVAMGLPATVSNRILQSYRGKIWITSPNEGGGEVPLTGLARACQVIGGKPSDSLEALRQAYRKKRSLYHPDRVQHTDMDPALARARLEEIHRAWDLINQRHPEAR